MNICTVVAQYVLKTIIIIISQSTLFLRDLLRFIDFPLFALDWHSLALKLQLFFNEYFNAHLLTSFSAIKNTSEKSGKRTSYLRHCLSISGFIELQPCQGYCPGRLYISALVLFDFI